MHPDELPASNAPEPASITQLRAARAARERAEATAYVRKLDATRALRQQRAARAHAMSQAGIRLKDIGLALGGVSIVRAHQLVRAGQTQAEAEARRKSL